MPRHPAAKLDAPLLRRRRPQRARLGALGPEGACETLGVARGRAGPDGRGRSRRGPGRRLRAGLDVRHDHRRGHGLVRHGRVLARAVAAPRRRPARRAARRPGARKGNGHVRPPPRPAGARALGRRQPGCSRSRTCRRRDVVGQAAGGRSDGERCAASRPSRTCRPAAASRPAMRARKRSTRPCGTARIRRAASPPSWPPGRAPPSSKGIEHERAT